MSVNKFASPKFEDFAILNGDDSKVGEIRVKPSGILWAPKNSKKWYGVSLQMFAEFMEKEGKLQDK